MRLVLRDVCGFRSCRVLCLRADYVHLPDEITGRGGGDRCGYLLVQDSHDGIHPVYYKTEIRTFFLLLQERGDVDPVALGYGFGV